MDAANVFRLISLIPDRSAWVASGSAYTPEGKSERVALLARLAHWLSPLEALSAEHQQFLGLRSHGGRPADAEAEGEGEGEAEDLELLEEVEETPVRQPEAGTQIAA